MLHLAITAILFTLSEINAYKRLQCKHCSRDAEHFFQIGFRAPTSFGITGKCDNTEYTASFFRSELFFIHRMAFLCFLNVFSPHFLAWHEFAAKLLNELL